MKRILPFRGLKYNRNIVGNLASVIAPPYDVISEQQQEMLYKSHPFNVVRLEYGETKDGDTDTENRYTRSFETLIEWMHSGVLITDRQPSLYVYTQEFDGEGGERLSSRGVICLVRLDEFETGYVVPHEQTLSKAKSDRLKLMRECGAGFSPVYSFYDDADGRVEEYIDKITARDAEISVKMTDGTGQKMWTVSDGEEISQIISELEDKQLFIADGHQRYEAAMEYRNLMREINPEHTGNELYNYVMMFLTDISRSGSVILPIHRMVKNVVGFNEQSVVSMLENFFTVEKVVAEDIESSAKAKLEKNKNVTAFAMYTGKDYYYLLKLNSSELTKDVNGPDVTVLHKLVFGDVLDMSDADIRNQKHLDYTEDVNIALSEVAAGNYQCSFILNPVAVSEIEEVSQLQEKLPQKSTYFYPKIKTGLVMNKFN